MNKLSASVDEIASDFLEHVTVSDTTVVVAVEDGSRNADRRTTEGEGSLMDMDSPEEEARSSSIGENTSDFLEHVTVSDTTGKIFEFSVKQSDDKKNVIVKGVLTIGDKVIIVDQENKKLKLFDHSGRYLSATALKDVTCGITNINEDRVATCGLVSKVLLWTLQDEQIINEDVTYEVDNWGDGIHYNGTYYCVLHQLDNAVTILDRQGRRVKKIVVKEAFEKKIEIGMDIYMDCDTHNIPCWPDNRGVLCMSVEGEALWFTPIGDVALFGMTEIHGVLCIANSEERTQYLHLISKAGQSMGKLPKREDLDGRPYYIHYDEQKQRLYVSHFFTTEKRDIISVYSVA